MILKIIKYKNYGMKMWSDPNFGERDEFSNNFFWTFFELNNGKTLSLMFIENLTNNKITSTDLSCHYTSHYKFEEDFTLWWNRDGNIDDGLGYPSEDEETLIKVFFEENIENLRNIETDITYLNK